jgi:hypothetical protein
MACATPESALAQLQPAGTDRAPKQLYDVGEHARMVA